MKKLLFVILIETFQSCSVRTIPLQGKYQETPVKTNFSNSFDEVWTGIVKFITDTGQDVQLLDKSSGVVISDAHIAYGMHISNEDKRGRIIDPRALIVCDHKSNEFPRGELIFHKALAKWTIGVRSVSEKETVVSVLLHVKDVMIDLDKWSRHYTGVSTGNHEKWILDRIIENVDGRELSSRPK